MDFPFPCRQAVPLYLLELDKTITFQALKRIDLRGGTREKRPQSFFLHTSMLVKFWSRLECVFWTTTKEISFDQPSARSKMTPPPLQPKGRGCDNVLPA
jgi:hypothetical protein